MEKNATLVAPIEARRDANRDKEICFACAGRRLSRLDDIADHHASTGRRYSLIVCEACGSARLGEALSTQELEQLYPPTFYSYNAENRDSHPLIEALSRLRYNRHRFRPRFSKLLEIGSGCGAFLTTIKDRGDVVGLERSYAARAKAEQLGVEVRVGDVSDSDLFAPSSFDYAYLSHSFEHIDEPAAALASLHRWLRADGKVFIAIPNFDGALPRLLRRSWYNLALPLHVSQFTPAGITALLERNGFAVDRIAYNSDPISLPMTALFATGATIGSMSKLIQIAMMGTALLCVPLSRLLDRLHLGDCLEVHARKI